MCIRHMKRNNNNNVFSCGPTQTCYTGSHKRIRSKQNMVSLKIQLPRYTLEDVYVCITAR